MTLIIAEKFIMFRHHDNYYRDHSRQDDCHRQLIIATFMIMIVVVLVKYHCEDQDASLASYTFSGALNFHVVVAIIQMISQLSKL